MLQGIGKILGKPGGRSAVHHTVIVGNGQAHGRVGLKLAVDPVSYTHLKSSRTTAFFFSAYAILCTGMEKPAIFSISIIPFCINIASFCVKFV